MKFLKKQIKISKDFLELITHSKNYIVARFLTLGLSFLTLPIFTRLMDPGDYGVLSVFVSFEGIVVIIFGLGTRGAVSRYYYEDKNDFFEYLSSNIWLVLLSDIVLTSIAIIFRYQLKDFLNIPMGMIYIAFGIAIPQAIFQLYQSYLQSAKKSKKVVSLDILLAIIGTSIAILIMSQMKSNRYYGKAIGELIGISILFIISIWYLKRNISFSIKKEHLSYSLVFGLPIIFHLLSQNILSTFDQVIINQLVGKYETGIYSVAYKIGMVQNIISTGILTAWTPMFYEKLNHNKINDINVLTKKYAFIVMLVATFLIFFSKEIIIVLVPKSYQAALGIIPIIILSYFFFFLYTMYVNYAFYEKKTKNIAVITIITGGINILLNYLLIPRFGYIAAAWTTLISYFILFFFNYVNVKWILKLKQITNIRIFILPTIILIVVLLLNYFLIVNNIAVITNLIVRIFAFSVLVFISVRIFTHSPQKIIKQ